MSMFSRVSICRNEFENSEPAENCSIALQPDSNRIAFKTCPQRNTSYHTETVIYDPGLRNSIGFALSRWLGDGHPVCSYGMRFEDADAYRNWRRSVWFEDCDVSWHIVFEFKDGRIVTYVCIGQYPFPAELTDIIREVIDHRNHPIRRR